MIYCYIDESGTASRKDKRPFIVAMAMFGSLDEVNEMIEKIRKFKLRNNIPQDFEFHYSRNAKTKKDKFVRFVRREVKEFDVFEASKDMAKDGYEELADMIACSLSANIKYRFYIDENPRLQAVLKKAFKTHRVAARITQTSSKNNEVIQIADYLAGIASEKRH
ncbi:MAG: DUF3800 domain-containing protein [Candidatus Saccharibacteria bacterium]|nr:DUF3800 domain-containing protein [Candidatus Saccharibacteria bacterium]